MWSTLTCVYIHTVLFYLSDLWPSLFSGIPYLSVAEHFPLHRRELWAKDGVATKTSCQLHIDIYFAVVSFSSALMLSWTNNPLQNNNDFIPWVSCRYTWVTTRVCRSWRACCPPLQPDSWPLLSLGPRFPPGRLPLDRASLLGWLRGEMLMCLSPPILWSGPGLRRTLR